MKKEQNGRDSLRRLKFGVGGNASKRRKNNLTKTVWAPSVESKNKAVQRKLIFAI